MPVKIVQAYPVTVLERELGQEFAGRLPDATIATLAEEEVAVFEKARVREFVLLLAGRRARIRAKQMVAVDRTAAAVETAVLD